MKIKQRNAPRLPTVQVQAGVLGGEIPAGTLAVESLLWRWLLNVRRAALLPWDWPE